MSDGIARVQDRVESAQPIAHERMRRGTQRMRPREPASTTNAAPMLLLSDSSPGVALLVIGVGTKLWAIRTLGSDAFHYRSFFEPAQTVEHVRSGPYRWCRAPMYTLGYAHAYGVALVLLSWPALVAAAFDQLTILAFERWVERPHDRDALRASTAG